MKSITFTIAVVAAANYANARKLTRGTGGDIQGFIDYITVNSKQYENLSDFEVRQQNYNDSSAKIDECNEKAIEARQNGEVEPVECGHNFTSDMDYREYSGLLGLNEDILELGKGTRVNDASLDDELFLTDSSGVSIVPAVNVDHAADGYMSPVKNQGGCGSCWAFAALTTLEGTIARKSNKAPVHLSEQEGVDCTTNTDANIAAFGKKYNNGGCNGGWMEYHWDFVRDQGVMLEKDYPYKGVDQLCSHDTTKTLPGRVTEYGQIGSNIETFKKRVEQQPISVALNASSDAWRYYKTGVVKASDCSVDLNHGVVVVGYTSGSSANSCTVKDWYTTDCTSSESSDSAGDQNYWKIQNSWGANWGDKGFIKFEIVGDKGTCGINRVAQWVEWDNYTN